MSNWELSLLVCSFTYFFFPFNIIFYCFIDVFFLKKNIHAMPLTSESLIFFNLEMNNV